MSELTDQDEAISLAAGAVFTQLAARLGESAEAWRGAADALFAACHPARSILEAAIDDLEAAVNEPLASRDLAAQLLLCVGMVERIAALVEDRVHP
jgi:maleate cis-trans isomerase